MHIRPNTPEADRVKNVYIMRNGQYRRVDQPLEVNTTEGWVLAYVPKLFGGVKYEAGQESLQPMNNENPSFSLQLIKLEGEVKVEFVEDSDG